METWSSVDISAEIRKAGFLLPLPKRKPNMHGGRHLINLVCAFDIETTRLDLPIPDGAKQNSHSFMYIWQFQMGGHTIIGRTWAEFVLFVDRIREAIIDYQKDQSFLYTPRLIVFVHNLAYEWQYLQGVFHFDNDDVFFREPRKPIYCRIYDCIEFRCSYMQTNMSLSHLCKQMQVEEKLSGAEFDYNKQRFPWTELTDYELEYCVRDVRSLVAAMKKRMEHDGDTLQTIPLTSTGYVRRDCKAAIKPLYMDIRDIKPDIKRYMLLRQAFRGGNTHANRKYVNQILTGVQSYDMTSCYPAQQLTKRFPMGKFKFIDDRLTLDRIHKFIGLGYAVICKYQFKNLELKPGVTIPYLSLARTRSAGFGLDNGRILYADICECVLTEIDLMIVLKQYSFDEMHIVTCMVAKKDFLPNEYRDVIRNYYEKKTVLKGCTEYEEYYQYCKSKELLNSVYGMSCQDPIHSEVLYDDGAYTEVNLYDYPDKAAKALLQAPFPYQWGVYVTAYARAALQEAIDLAGPSMVYCDTDSVKVLGSLDLSGINAKRTKSAIQQKAFAKDRKGISHYMGVFEYEGTYDKFITQGAKRYAYEMGGKIGITVAGVSKAINPKTGIPIAVEELRSLDRFKVNMVWRKAAGTMAVYNDSDNFTYVDPVSGKSVQITPNLAILPTTYKMTYSRDYNTLLQDITLYGEYVDKRS